MSSREVLICGASVAGPALAFWLHHHGMQATVVERAPALRPGGQTVDLRGIGRVVAERMGIIEAVRAASTGEAGIRFLDGSGRTRAEFSVDAFGGEGVIAELEILRGQLSSLLYQQTSGNTEYVFGDEVTGIVDDGRRVQVAFARGNDRTFDLVVAADGARSRTRDLAFGDTTRVRELGQCMASFTIPREDSDGAWARCFNATGGRMIALRPDTKARPRH